MDQNYLWTKYTRFPNLSLKVACVLGLVCTIGIFMSQPRVTRVLYTTQSEQIPSACPVNCEPDFPCQYQQEVDFRVIVLTMDRPDSLTKCLDSVSGLETLGDNVHVNIWVDRFKDGSVDSRTLEISQAFADRWQHVLKKGSACVTVQPRNAYIHLQWVNSWRPQVDTKEIAIIVEDDVDISPFAYKWLKLAHKRYDDDFRVTGYAIQGQNLLAFGTLKNGTWPKKEMNGPKTDNTFYSPFIKTWGFSPNAKNWRFFQEWFLKHRWNSKLKPYVKNSVTTEWFKLMEQEGEEASHWSQWHHYYSSLYKFYCVFTNFAHTAGQYLASNRLEKGLHYKSNKKRIEYDPNLLQKWSAEFERFPSNPVHLDMYGNLVKTKKIK